jgi:hypothetical protein
MRARDLQGLLAGVGLGDVELVDVDAALAGPGGVEGVLGVDEGADAAELLGLAATMCWQRVVLPEDSGPKISTMRPRGMPLTGEDDTTTSAARQSEGQCGELRH